MQVTDLFYSVRDEIRTHTSQRPLPPQSSVSTNSTTRTYGISSFFSWCPEQDSNLHASRHTHLKRARLPIPPPGHSHRRDTDGAKNGTRTRDPNLGKVVLYQLSYFRICECKDNFTFRFMQEVLSFFSSGNVFFDS